MTIRFRRFCGLLGGVLSLALAVGACGNSTNSGSNGATTSGPVSLTWWHNASQDPGKAFWQTVADEYHAAHPNVTINVVPIQNEQFTTKIPVALQSQSPPDVFQQWGGGQLADQVAAGKVMDITNDVKPWISQIGTAAGNWQVNGKQYGIPYNLGLSASGTTRTSSRRPGSARRPPRGTSSWRTPGSSRPRASRRSPSAGRTAGRTPSTGTISRSANAARAS